MITKNELAKRSGCAVTTVRAYRKHMPKSLWVKKGQEFFYKEEAVEWLQQHLKRLKSSPQAAENSVEENYADWLTTKETSVQSGISGQMLRYLIKTQMPKALWTKINNQYFFHPNTSEWLKKWRPKKPTGRPPKKPSQ